ncbi:MAG: hypothetical protein DI536_19375 [Archangium gephyra]|uniref:Uncharacterized protein n=1 Tax=Archangium gephyra TaxID=48 RepID=A0A2W5TEH9_9BACT|nr:MAG: hypothetical protein DI536_19375 [Archangium gephyra]
MKTHTTNYEDTFIAIAKDSSATKGTEPDAAKPTIASITFRLIHENPYRFTSDDVLFMVHAERKGIPEAKWDQERKAFFAKPQACLRASPLPKTYGWGIHSDERGRVALYPVESKDYKKLEKSAATVRFAMASSRAK